MAAIIELLVKIQLIDDRQHDAVMSRSRSGSGGQIVQKVAEMGYATEGAVARAISVELGIPRIDLAMTPPEPAAIELLDVRTCAERFVLPVALRENGELLWLAMADPTDEESINVVRRKTSKRVRPAVAGPSEILRAARLLYNSPTAGSGLPDPASAEAVRAIELREEAGEADEAFEVVNVSEELGSPIARLAAQLGVTIPANLPSGRSAQPGLGPLEIDLEGIGQDVGGTFVGGTFMDARPEAPQRHIPPQGAPQGQPRPPSSAASRPQKQPGSKPATPARPPSTSGTKTAPAAALRSESATRAGRPLDDNDLLSPLTTPGPIAEDDLTPDDLQTIVALGQSMEKGALVLRALAELCVEKGVLTREEMRRKNR